MISDVMKDYVDAIIKVKVPKWQIGEQVLIHFPDTMCKHSVCERADGRKYSKCIRCGKVLKNHIAQERGYGEICWKKHLSDDQITLF